MVDGAHRAVARARPLLPVPRGTARRGVILVLLGVYLLGQRLIVPFTNVVRARSWERAPVVRYDFRLLRFHGAWSSDPTYVYEVRGKKYSGHRVMFIDPVEFLPEDELLRLQDTPSTCFANPNEPWNSVVVRELPLRASVVGMPAVAALAAGVWVFWSGYRRRSAPRV